MKRLLLFACCLLLSGCSDSCNGFKANYKFVSHGTVYLVSCMQTSDGVYYTLIPYAIDGDFPSGPAETFSSHASTCAQGANSLRISKGGVFANAIRRAQTTSPAAQPSELEYLLDQTSLSVQIIDPSPFNFTEVDLPGGGDTQYPTSMAATPDGSAIWVTQLAIPQNTEGLTPEPPLVSIMNVNQQAFTGSFTLPNGISPNTIQISPDGTSAYISNDVTGGNTYPASANSSVLVVDVARQTVTETIPTPKGAGSEALSPDGLLLYTIGSNLGLGANNLTVIDTTTNTVATSVALPDGGVKLFVNPTGTRLYVIWLRGIDVFDTATLQQVATIPGTFTFLTNFAYFTPDGATAWLYSGGYGIAYQVDVRTNQITNTIQGPAHNFMFGTP